MTKQELNAIKNVNNVVATMAIENMYLEKNFIDKLLEVELGIRKSEDLRQEVIREYGR